MIKVGDFILITDSKDDKYLQIGEVISIKYSKANQGLDCYDINVRFNGGEICKYDFDLYSRCKVLMLYGY